MKLLTLEDFYNTSSLKQEFEVLDKFLPAAGGRSNTLERTIAVSNMAMKLALENRRELRKLAAFFEDA